MKWLNKNWGISSPKEGDTRVIRKFVWWPRNYKNSRYWYWLQKINIVEEFIECGDIYNPLNSYKYQERKVYYKWKERELYINN